MSYINHNEAAKILEIPEIAIGQCMFDGKLTPKHGLDFDSNDVNELKKNQPDYLESLK